ncbi:MAG TPA: dienelactone hydrolase family protein [Thermoanaerobaculia bacterium]|nr:dienelactone hydrolase family protein [Thermoanaerobaculia bacterium]
MNDAGETIPFQLKTSDSSLNGLIDLPAAPGERPAVVICHSVKGSMEWGFIPYLAALLAARGFVAIRSESREPADVLTVLEATGETLAPGRVDRRRLGLFGYGQEGGKAILAAARSPWIDRVRALVTWAATTNQDVLTAAAALRAPWLIVHGGEDEIVPADDGLRLAAIATGEHELRVIPGASHTFGSRHPFAGPTPQLIQALNATQRWFRAHL